MHGSPWEGWYLRERRGGGSENNPSGRSLDQERKRDGFSRNCVERVALFNDPSRFPQYSKFPRQVDDKREGKGAAP